MPGDLLVMNDSKVIPARFYGTKLTAERSNFLVERILDDQTFLATHQNQQSLKTRCSNSIGITIGAVGGGGKNGFFFGFGGGGDPQKRDFF